MHVFESTMDGVDSSVPRVWAGELTFLRRAGSPVRFSPTGGGGMFFSKGALERFRTPIRCNRGKKQRHQQDFESKVCSRIRQNLIGERRVWHDFDNLLTFLERLARQEIFCFISGHLIGHFINYYYLSDIWTDEPIFYENVSYPPRILPCLLYTSPSPRDLSTSRMPSSA